MRTFGGPSSGGSATDRADPKDRIELFNLMTTVCRLKARRGDSTAAIELYRKSVEANPDFAEGFFYLAKALLDQGILLNDAETFARKGLALDPDGQTSPLGHFVIGGVMMKRGQAAAAERELNKGLALEARLAKRAR